MAKEEQDVEIAREKIVTTEKNLLEKKRERAAKGKGGSPSLNERLVAPILLILTLLISYLIVLLG
jgi:hypothetical protein